MSISKCKVELEPIPFDELPIEMQQWLQSAEYEDMGSSLQSYRDMGLPARKRRRVRKDVTILSESNQ